MTGGRGLWRHGAFAMVLSGAGLPAYLLAPLYYADAYGATAADLLIAVGAIRLLDMAQDPFLGRLAGATRRAGGLTAWLAGAGMAGAMWMLFAVPPFLPPVWWLAAALAIVVSTSSFLTIRLYARGVAKAVEAGGDHVGLAAWRGAGAFAGICGWIVLPTAFKVLVASTGIDLSAHAAYAAIFGAAVAVALLLTMRDWSAPAPPPAPSRFRAVASDAGARRLLRVASLAAAPLAVSATLFLPYVSEVLLRPGASGVLLIAVFAAAAAAAPLWGWLAHRIGPRRALIAATALSLAAVASAGPLGPEDLLATTLACIACGTAIGADLTLLPAMFARRLAALSPDGIAGFALWSCGTKAAVTLAAICGLPLFRAAGLREGGTNGDGSVWLLTILLVGLPLLSKAVVLLMLLRRGAGIR